MSLQRNLIAWFGVVLLGLFIIHGGLAAKDSAKETAQDVLDQDLYTLQQKAAEAHRAGAYDKALPLYIELLKYNRRNPLTLYNLACCYALLDEPKLAVTCLYQAAMNGLVRLADIEKDTDFSKISRKTPFQNVLEDIAKHHQNLGEKHYVVAPKLIPFWLRFPKAYTPQKAYPLVIAMHGNGGNPLNFRQLAYLFDEQDMILAVPQGAYVHPQDGMGTQFQYTFGFPSPDQSLWRKIRLSPISPISACPQSPSTFSGGHAVPPDVLKEGLRWIRRWLRQ